MDDDVVIKLEHVSKKYCKSMKHSILYGVQDIGRNLLGMSSHSENLRKTEFWAVDDVSLQLKKGEMLGLIGPNGSGKSTLLKLLNGIFWPDKGKITIRGRVGALIEVGAGFHPLLTGRENIYINAAILGMEKDEVDARFEDIVKFADIGDFIDAPVKSYSSGMYVRLGFAVAAYSKPDILLVDEVLAVGDINFQHKCLRYMADMMDKSTIILVNHNPDVVRYACKKVLFLNGGKAQFYGAASEGVEEYVNYMIRRTLPDTNSLQPTSDYDSKVELNSIEFLDEKHNITTEVNAGDSLTVECAFSVKKLIRRAIVGIALYLDARERSFICYSSQVDSEKLVDLPAGEYKFRAKLPRVILRAGIYHLAVMVSEKNELASHTWNTNKYILVKNPRPELGFYPMSCQFDLEENKKDLV